MPVSGSLAYLGQPQLPSACLTIKVPRLPQSYYKTACPSFLPKPRQPGCASADGRSKPISDRSCVPFKPGLPLPGEVGSPVAGNGSSACNSLEATMQSWPGKASGSSGEVVFKPDVSHVMGSGCDRPSANGWAPHVQGQGIPGALQESKMEVLSSTGALPEMPGQSLLGLPDVRGRAWLCRAMPRLSYPGWAAISSMAGASTNKSRSTQSKKQTVHSHQWVVSA